ncbi:ornithine cyclodeaminase family protein [Natrarchaeobius chitinivorans]|uniref:Alanine dehydrogenase n=1 Tax=Natrarchaeobius chitinivorans TaxID=1679083 RepID=A0A3N6LV04_NATCH|nr:ornithine cyclodeaminase family protein [Natrarchaeobius chitinivorans]RQG94178.1 ornithine cyclodeaminase family protein [Natrarchaeobius chitinivorans]
MHTLLLNREDVESAAQPEEVVRAVEAAFAAYERNAVVMPAKSYIDFERYNGDFRSMPAYLDTGEWDAAGLKWVNVHPDNPEKHGLPTVMGTMIYSDPETALPRAILDGTELTRQRTGAAAAVATAHLAVPDAESLGLVGAGAQSYTQLEAISEVRPIQEVVVADKDDERVTRFIDAFEDEFDVHAGTIAEAGHCDVLSTVTPVIDPIVDLEDVGETTHINAMGADAVGKQELQTSLLQEATLVIDDYDQCTHSGEINVPYAGGAITDADIAAELGMLIVGDYPGRNAESGVTVFDSTGLAIQDVAAAHVVYETARNTDIGIEFDLLGIAENRS